MKKVCILGAGASGLAAIKHVSESPYLEGVVFEQGSSIGGLWAYTDEVKDAKGEPVHSSMYDSLRTHLPKQLMSYPDFPFGKTEGSFLTHSEMLQYMKEFSASYKLSRYIKLQHRVISVKPIFSNKTCENDCKWNVKVKDLQSKTVSTYEFDSVIVCNGHCFKPFQPELENQNVFQGEIMHSKDYRKPDCFAGRKVLVVGGGLTALDLSIEIASKAEEVIFSHTKKENIDPIWLPENVVQVSKVDSVFENGVLLKNGEEITVDIILFCTGYEYNYPFLQLSECKLEVVDGKYVRPLYKHFIHSKFNSLAFFGLPFLNAAFPLFDCQARYYVKFLEGKIKLPSESEMNCQIDYDFNLKKNNGLGLSKSHSMENQPWGYYKSLGAEAKFDLSWIPLMRSIFSHVNERRDQFPTLYKDDKIIVKSQNEYEYIAIEETIIELR